MDRAFWRLLVICFAWSLGAVLLSRYVFDAPGLDPLVPALLAAAAFVLTRDVGYRSRGPGGGGNVKYWRGRRVDDRPPRRWN